MNTKRMTWGFLLLWLLIALVGTAVSFTVFFGVMTGLGTGGGTIPDYLGSLVMTATFGIFIALAQWMVLRRFLPRSAVWIGVTLVGFLLCSPFLLGNFGPAIPTAASLGMTIGLGGLLGVVQWLAIRKVKWGSAWIGVSLVSWFLAGLTGLALKRLSFQMGPILYWLGLIFAGTLLSVLGMMGLFNIKRDTRLSQPGVPDQPLWRRILIPGTSLGWCSVALLAIYGVLIFVPRLLAGRVSWGETAGWTLVMLMAFISWAAGIVGLTAVMEKRERSVLVWLAMLPAAYALINTLYLALRLFLGMQ